MSAALEEFGPFRGYWCLPWEAYIQILKRMFNMTNWKAAPYTVARNWATKSVMHYRDPARGSWYTNEVDANSEWYSDVESLAKRSRLIRALVSTAADATLSDLRSARFLRRVTRGRDEVKCGDWLVVRQQGMPARVGRVEQMAQCNMRGVSSSVIRLWCEQSKKIHDDLESSVMWAAQGDSEQCLLVSFETVYVEVVVRSVRATRDEFL